jgi:Domain of unknown function (DUF4304)
MATRSVYRDFISAIKKHWRSESPSICPIKESFGPIMPKASTFHAGMSKPSGMHVFFNFQHSSKSWEVGQFTINVILSRGEGPPEGSFGPFPPEGSDPFREGSYRIGLLVGQKDKWWHLKDDPAPILTQAWRPSSYDDQPTVISEAVVSVDREIRAVLRRFGMAETGPA